MGIILDSFISEATNKNRTDTTPVAVHAKKDYVPTITGFVAISKQDVEAKRRSAYAYAF
jgi:hypothetical protein